MKMTQFKKWKADPSKGEVFTPISLVSEMLDKIPDEVWKNPNSKFLDPCMGKGTFLIEIVRRLTYIYGYTETEAISRVYGYDIRVKYINHLQRRGFINVRHKDFLNEEINMKFDAIVGNPPFQNSLENGQKSKNTLWARFIKKSSELINQNGYILMISPDGWCSPTDDIPQGKISIFRDIFKTKNLISVSTNDIIKKYFKGVGTSFTYFLYQNKEYSGTTTFHTKEGDFTFDISKLSFIPKKIDETSFSIHGKILNPKNNFIFERYQKKDGGMLDQRHPHYSIPKVKFSRGMAEFHVSGDQGTQGYDVFTYAYFIEENETVDSAKSVLNSKIYKFVLNQKWNQYFTKFIPNSVFKPKLDKIYTEEELSLILGLNSNELQYIESNVD